MLPFENMRLVDPAAAKSPRWLLRPARYDDAPALRCMIDGCPSVIPLGDARGTAFHILDAPAGEPWVAADGAILDADPAFIAHMSKGSVPLGSVCIIKETAVICARYNFSEIFVSVKTGERVEPDLRNFIALSHWRLTMPGHDGDRVEIFSTVPVSTSADEGPEKR